MSYWLLKYLVTLWDRQLTTQNQNKFQKVKRKWQKIKKEKYGVIWRFLYKLKLFEKISTIFFSHVNFWTKLDLQAHMGQYATHASTTLCPSLMLQLASPAQGGRDSMQTLGAKNESSNKKNWTGPACGEWEINDTFICGGILPRYSTLANKCHWLLWCPEIDNTEIEE